MGLVADFHERLAQLAELEVEAELHIRHLIREELASIANDAMGELPEANICGGEALDILAFVAGQRANTA